MLGQLVIFEHMQQCGLSSIVQAEEQQFARLFPQTCKEGGVECQSLVQIVTNFVFAAKPIKQRLVWGVYLVT